MARRRGRAYSSRCGSRGIMGGMGGISIKGILVGMGAAYASDGLIPQMIPYQDVVEGAVVGKFAKTGLISGAIGGLVKTMLQGGAITGKTGTGVYN